MEIVKVAVVGIIATLLAIKLKGYNQEYSIYISLAASIFILVFAVGQLKMIVEFMETISGYISMNSIYLRTLLKLVGIAYVCEFASSLCKDAGYGAIAGQIEIVGKLSILVVSMPIVLALLDTLSTFLS